MCHIFTLFLDLYIVEDDKLRLPNTEMGTLGDFLRFREKHAIISSLRTRRIH